MATSHLENQNEETLWTILFCFRTAKDIQVLEYHEIHPKRTAFVTALGEGAFGKVHLATYKAGLEYFKDNQESSRQIRKQFVAIKELHGKPFTMLLLLFFVCLFLSFLLLLLLLPRPFLQLFLFHFISFYLKMIDNKGTFNFVKWPTTIYSLSWIPKH